MRSPFQKRWMSISTNGLVNNQDQNSNDADNHKEFATIQPARAKGCGRTTKPPHHTRPPYCGRADCAKKEILQCKLKIPMKTISAL